jgi:hypothetical protein
MKIEPVGAAEVPSVWTEFRIIAEERERDRSKGIGETSEMRRPAAKALDNVVAIGDRVQIQGAPPDASVSLRLTAGHHDPLGSYQRQRQRVQRC